MANRALIPAVAPKTYAELKRGVEETLLAGQRRVEQAIFLNNVLLENGHAVRMDGNAPKEWE